jgi:hypothetical protein
MKLASYSKRVLKVPASSAAVKEFLASVVQFYVHLDEACPMVYVFEMLMYLRGVSSKRRIC